MLDHGLAPNHKVINPKKDVTLVEDTVQPVPGP